MADPQVLGTVDEDKADSSPGESVAKFRQGVIQWADFRSHRGDLLEIHGERPAEESLAVRFFVFESHRSIPMPPGASGGILEGPGDPLLFRGGKPMLFTGVRVGC